MSDEVVERLTEIRSLASFFGDAGESTQLQDYKSRMFQTAARPTEAAASLAGGATDRPMG
jgi:hypothetical protein